MTAPPPARYSPDWLGLREPADAAARSRDLAALLAGDLARDPSPERPVVVHDLGCGTGSMGRWLAPLLPGPQHWVLHDRDPDLLAIAARSLPSTAADGTGVTVETRPGDVARLTPADLAGARVVTASALLDLLTGDEVVRLAEACTGAGCAVLLTLSVTGRVELTPADPLDAAIAAAFDAHQRRAVAGRRLLGPDAVPATEAAFARLGGTVRRAGTPWRLGPDDAALAAEWLTGWVGAALEERPDLPLGDYPARRLAAAAAGGLEVAVHHADLLVERRRPAGQQRSG